MPDGSDRRKYSRCEKYADQHRKNKTCILHTLRFALCMITATPHFRANPLSPVETKLLSRAVTWNGGSVPAWGRRSGFSLGVAALFTNRYALQPARRLATGHSIAGHRLEELINVAHFEYASRKCEQQRPSKWRHDRSCQTQYAQSYRAGS
jgi:hypothetical protein